MTRAPLADCHAHILDDGRTYALAPDRREDPPLVPFEDALAAYRAMHAKLGIRRGVLVSSNLFAGNALARDALARLPAGRYRGVALLAPDAADAELYALDQAGFRAARLNLRTPAPLGLANVARFARRLADRGWHIEVLMHCCEVLPAAEAALAALPVPVVLDHMAMPDPADPRWPAARASVLRLMASGRVWAKLSAPYRIADDPPAYAAARAWIKELAAANPDRLVWGTDWPHVRYGGSRPDEGALLSSLKAALADRRLIDGVLVHNPEALYGFTT